MRVLIMWARTYSCDDECRRAGFADRRRILSYASLRRDLRAHHHEGVSLWPYFFMLIMIEASSNFFDGLDDGSLVLRGMTKNVERKRKELVASVNGFHTRHLSSLALRNTVVSWLSDCMIVLNL